MTRNREMLLKEIQQLSFRLYDLGLFLDTHPTEESAIALYNVTLNKYKSMVSNFEKLYGPLSRRSDETGTEKWNWINGPWPWENAENKEVCE